MKFMTEVIILLPIILVQTIRSSEPDTTAHPSHTINESFEFEIDQTANNYSLVLEKRNEILQQIVDLYKERANKAEYRLETFKIYISVRALLDHPGDSLCPINYGDGWSQLDQMYKWGIIFNIIDEIDHDSLSPQLRVMKILNDRLKWFFVGGGTPTFRGHLANELYKEVHAIERCLTGDQYCAEDVFQITRPWVREIAWYLYHKV